MHFNKITIIGLGLIGGSLALALKQSGQVGSVVGVDANAKSIETALNRGIIDEGHVDNTDATIDSDIVVIATYVSSIVDIAKLLKVSDNTVVTDTGSVKGEVVNQIKESCDFSFVGSHPIAGTEKSGVDNIVQGLFEDKLTVITPTNNTAAYAIKAVSNMWRIVGSRVEQMNAEIHDKIFANVSHLPHVAAFSLVNSLINRDISFFNYAGGGLKDYSRIAESSPVMWADILISNKDEILKAIDGFKGSLNQIEQSIESSDKENLKNILSAASNIKKS